MDKIYVVTIDEEFEKAQVKGFTRTRKGKMERVNPYGRGGGGREGAHTWSTSTGAHRLHPKSGKEQSMGFRGWYDTPYSKKGLALKQKLEGK